MSLHPVITHAESVATLDVLGTVTRILLDGKQTHGALALVEIIAPVGSQIPPHVHRKEDEVFHMVDGQLEFWCGGHTSHLRTGDTAFAPRMVPHSFKVVGEAPARILVAVNPAGFERFFREIDEMAGRGEATPERAGQLMREQYDCEFVDAAPKAPGAA